MILPATCSFLPVNVGSFPRRLFGECGFELARARRAGRADSLERRPDGCLDLLLQLTPNWVQALVHLLQELLSDRLEGLVHLALQFLTDRLQRGIHLLPEPLAGMLEG